MTQTPPKPVTPLTDAYIERALELPAGTLRSWEGGNAPPEGTALLRIIRNFPWMVEVADRRFSKLEARKILLREAARAAIPATQDPLRDARALLEQILAECRSCAGDQDPDKLLVAALAELALERLGAPAPGGPDTDAMRKAREVLERAAAREPGATP